jgi:hypothetical protein
MNIILVCVTFQHCDKMFEKNSSKEERLNLVIISEVSVHGYMAWWLSGLWQSSTSWWKGPVEGSCLPHGGQEGRKEGGGKDGEEARRGDREREREKEREQEGKRRRRQNTVPKGPLPSTKSPLLSFHFLPTAHQIINPLIALIC